MAHSSKLAKIIATILSGSSLFANSVLANSIESNFWTERQKNQVASLPVISAYHPLTVGIEPTSQSSGRYSALLRSLPLNYGSVREIARAGKGTSGTTVIHIQDIHLNAEAQENIGKTIQLLTTQNQVDMVALEGAFEPINLQAFHASKYKNAVRMVADHLLQERTISGAIHAAFTGVGTLPAFIGIDDRAHYDANVAAYKNSAPHIQGYQERLRSTAQALNQQREQTFNPELLAFDRKQHAYQHEKLSLGDYLRTLQRYHELTPDTALFLEATTLEKQIDFRKAEMERTALIKQLVAHINQAAARELTERSVSYRLGNVSHSDFYAYLRSLCTNNGIDLKRTPSLNAYIHYALLTDRIHPNTIFSDIRRIEQQITDKLAKSIKEKQLSKKSRYAMLAEKLLSFALTTDEWDEYQHLKASNAKSTVGDLTSFEAFYEQARARDALLAKNLISSIRQKHASLVVVVTGGFHSAGINQRLKKAGITTITFAPKVTKTDSDNYLTVFMQQKTPLEKLFEGEKLFVAPVQKPNTAMVGVEVAATQAYLDQNNGTFDSALEALVPDAGEKLDASVHVNSEQAVVDLNSRTRLGSALQLTINFVNKTAIQSMNVAKTPLLRAHSWISWASHTDLLNMAAIATIYGNEMLHAMFNLISVTIDNSVATENIQAIGAPLPFIAWLIRSIASLFQTKSIPLKPSTARYQDLSTKVKSQISKTLYTQIVEQTTDIWGRVTEDHLQIILKKLGLPELRRDVISSLLSHLNKNRSNGNDAEIVTPAIKIALPDSVKTSPPPEVAAPRAPTVPTLRTRIIGILDRLIERVETESWIESPHLPELIALIKQIRRENKFELTADLPRGTFGQVRDGTLLSFSVSDLVHISDDEIEAFIIHEANHMRQKQKDRVQAARQLTRTMNNALNAKGPNAFTLPELEAPLSDVLKRYYALRCQNEFEAFSIEMQYRVRLAAAAGKSISDYLEGLAVRADKKGMADLAHAYRAHLQYVSNEGKLLVDKLRIFTVMYINIPRGVDVPGILLRRSANELNIPNQKPSQEQYRAWLLRFLEDPAYNEPGSSTSTTYNPQLRVETELKNPPFAALRARISGLIDQTIDHLEGDKWIDSPEIPEIIGLLKKKKNNFSIVENFPENPFGRARVDQDDKMDFSAAGLRFTPDPELASIILHEFVHLTKTQKARKAATEALMPVLIRSRNNDFFQLERGPELRNILKHTVAMLVQNEFEANTLQLKLRARQAATQGKNLTDYMVELAVNSAAKGSSSEAEGYREMLACLDDAGNIVDAKLRATLLFYIPLVGQSNVGVILQHLAAMEMGRVSSMPSKEEFLKWAAIWLSDPQYQRPPPTLPPLQNYSFLSLIPTLNSPSWLQITSIAVFGIIFIAKSEWMKTLRIKINRNTFQDHARLDEIADLITQAFSSSDDLAPVIPIGAMGVEGIRGGSFPAPRNVGFVGLSSSEQDYVVTRVQHLNQTLRRSMNLPQSRRRFMESA